MKNLLGKLKEWAGRLKAKILVLHCAYTDPGTGFLPKFIIFLTLGYALSPIDIIPDFIPVIGFLDDLLILPAMIALSIKLLPEDVMERAKRRAENEKPTLRKNWWFAGVIVLIWLALLVLILIKFLPFDEPG